MDLVAGVKRVVAVMEHTNKSGQSKVLRECRLPLTGKSCLDLIITDLCVFEVGQETLHLIELAPDVTVDEVRSKTEARCTISEELSVLAL